MEGIVLICNIDLYCAIAIFNSTADIFKTEILIQQSMHIISNFELDGEASIFGNKCVAS